ncbi:carboxylesterase family protein [Pseudocolwellia sp. HL-MZ19]|uniref:carboxylesterase family protein n=1 Tax=Pseudocolwellia sp. HL-MZ19 TaxID=3400846 RepID=UPI003CF5DA16
MKNTSKFGADCMQLPFPGDAAPLTGSVSEDCLFINVWKPKKAEGKKLPVMVWIHGGGFVNGGSSPDIYSGKAFAESGVILISFNYRLGRFGFFAHPALSAERDANTVGTNALGNYAFMDKIAALKWIQRNISSFGGDANNVTLFGESAGGRSVNALMLSPQSKGLFHKAIAQSAGGRSF